MMVRRAVVVKATMEKVLITIVSKKFFGVSAVSTPEGELLHLMVGGFFSFLQEICGYAGITANWLCFSASLLTFIARTGE